MLRIVPAEAVALRKLSEVFFLGDGHVGSFPGGSGLSSRIPTVGPQSPPEQ
jgi:hypothetical protein